MKPLPRGRYLASGMSITRTIFLTYISAMAVPQACLSIYVNDDLLLYEIEVYISSAYISMRPKILNFGEIDVGTASEQMGVQLSNCGHKGSSFVVDLGRNDLELIVHPMKGVIKPSETIEIRVEILGTQEGTFLKEFWIKTEPPQRVWITGTFIRAALVIEHPLPIFDLTLIDFPKTYYGAQSKRTLVIENNSSTASMFCTLAEQLREYVFLEEARKTDDNLKCFCITPREGRLSAKHKYILGVSFIPQKLKKFSQNYCMAFIRILKVNYRDGLIDDKDIEVKTFASSAELDQYSIASLHEVGSFDTEELEMSNGFLRVCLYGEIEEAAVELTPNAIDIAHLLEGETCIRTFNIRNKSMSLPISFKYDKIACIELEPEEPTLNPNGNIDVSIVIRPTRIGVVEQKIMLQLLYRCDNVSYEVGKSFIFLRYSTSSNPTLSRSMIKPKFNLGITPANANEVGFLVDDTRYNSTIKKPIKAIVDEDFERFNKNNANLIAFPNDRAGSLRPWRCDVPCTTIFANIPRYVNTQDKYILSKAELEKKQNEKSYYLEYLRSTHTKTETSESPGVGPKDYDNSNKNSLLMKRKWVYNTCSKLDFRDERVSLFIPMPPEELLNIQITPRYIQLGKIAPFTSCSDYFAIENKNEFPINISIRALSNSVVIKGKRRKTIVAHKTENIYFDCYSHGLGKYYVPVYIIVNDCHIFDATVFAEVVPTTVKSSQKEIIICPRSHSAFFEMLNPVNCNIDFNWEIQDANYKIEPLFGDVPPRRKLICEIKFAPQMDAIFTTEIYLLSQSGAKEIIKVVNENKKAEVLFHTQNLDFGDIPLNSVVTRKLILKNFSEEAVIVNLTNPNLMKGVKVHPTEGTLGAHSNIIFRVSVKFKAVGNFGCALVFRIQDEYIHRVEVTGNICYPKFSIEPKFIQIRKIETGAIHRRIFKVTNAGVTKNSISFFFLNFPEFSVTDIDRRPIESGIELEPNESKDLYLEFKPHEPTAYSLFFPYILNGLIGPPVLNDPRSLDPRHYFSEVEGLQISPECPNTVPLVRVRCAAGEALFTFSTLDLTFVYRQEICQSHFEVTNVSNSVHVLVLSVAEVVKPFSIAVEKCDRSSSLSSKYHQVELGPNEKVDWVVNYEPTEYGQSDLYLPFGIEAIKNGPSNFLRLSGTYPEPKFLCESKVLYLQTIPAEECISKGVRFQLLNHKGDCSIVSEITHPDLTSIFEERPTVSEDESELFMCVTFRPQSECTVSSEIKVSCTCGTSLELLVKCAAKNCRLLCYNFYLEEKFQEKNESFPYYPFDTTNEGFLEGMDAIVAIVEKFLYSQGFFYTDFFKIPDGISMYPFGIYREKGKTRSVKDEKTKKISENLPLVQLLINLLDDSVLNYFRYGVSKPSLNDLEGTVYDYGIYKDMMKFLNINDIFVQQLRPELLLTYERYVVFKNRLTDKDNCIGQSESLLPEEKFHSLSKQCWVDLLLGIYKVFVFDRTLQVGNIKPKPCSTPEVSIYANEFVEYYDNNIGYFQNCNENEAKLMLWLEFHFNNQKKLLWPKSDMKPRKIRSLEEDIKDGLPFVTLLSAYCPYISDFLRESYSNPTSTSLLFHNACVVSDSCTKLNLSYAMDPRRIFEPIGVEITMFATYLYGVLPNFYPSETIPINSPLGETAANEIELKNCGAVPIAYQISLFLNESEEFEISSNTVIVNPKKIKKIKVEYTAKSFLESKAVLVLSGETDGFRFAKSKAVNLIGIPDIFHFTEEFSIKTDMYKPVTHYLVICSPYARSYIAETYFYIKTGGESRCLKDFVSVSSLKKDKVPRQICIDDCCVFDNEGKFTLTLKLCFVTCGLYEHYIHFLNKEVGVFCIKLLVDCTLSDKTRDDLVIALPTNSFGDCKCKNGVMNYLCPRIIYFDIPCRNNYLLEGLRKMIEVCADSNEYKFWEEHLVYPKGFRILGKYLENTFDDNLIDFKNVLNQTISFDTKVKGKKFSVVPSFLIHDVTCGGGHKISIHWNVDEIPKKEILILTAAHGQETRRYQLFFKMK
nr:cilia- and flagella-associated protein 47-like [Leptinotarsa decemlineata]